MTDQQQQQQQQQQQPEQQPEQEPTKIPFLTKFIGTRLSELDPATFFTSYYVSPEGLLMFRSFGAFWTTFIYIFSFAAPPPSFPRQILFGFFTNLTWGGLMLYFWVSSVCTFFYIRRNYTTEFFTKKPKFFQWLYWQLYVLPAVYHWIVPLVFWSVLAPGGLFSRNTRAIDWWNNINLHVMDGVFVMIELIMGRIPLFYSQWTMFIFVSLTYLCWIPVTNILFTPLLDPQRWPDGFYPYPFVNFRQWYVVYTVPAVVLFFLVTFVVVVAVHRGRDRRRVRLGWVVKKGRKQVEEGEGDEEKTTGNNRKEQDVESGLVSGLVSGSREGGGDGDGGVVEVVDEVK
jgi:hypothetical protein